MISLCFNCESNNEDIIITLSSVAWLCLCGCLCMWVWGVGRVWGKREERGRNKEGGKRKATPTGTFLSIEDPFHLRSSFTLLQNTKHCSISSTHCNHSWHGIYDASICNKIKHSSTK